LAPGDALIVTGHRYVGPGQPVNVVELDETTLPGRGIGVLNRAGS
jgi:hypothetical protein